jgi:YD repeat-containing protein
VVDTLGRTVAFTYDSAGRVKRQDLPGGRSVSYAYDGNGNLSTLTPPGRPAHGFLHTAVDLVEEYIPPDVGLAEERTRYGYDLDRNLETILRPDGIEVSLGYDGAGRLATVTVPEGVVDLDYDWAGRLGCHQACKAPQRSALKVPHPIPEEVRDGGSRRS